MTKEAITISALNSYLTQARQNHADPQALVDQLQLFALGIRDERLGDNAITLIDGTVEYEDNPADTQPGRTWKCLRCGKTVQWTYDHLADLGLPICGETDCPGGDDDMELVSLSHK